MTIEMPGYGISPDTDKESSVENILNETGGTMKHLNINPPYILMQHSISGLYSLYYANQYPEEIEANIGIDCSMAKQFDNTPIPTVSDSAKSMYRFMDKSGITRLTT